MGAGRRTSRSCAQFCSTHRVGDSVTDLCGEVLVSKSIPTKPDLAKLDMERPLRSRIKKKKVSLAQQELVHTQKVRPVAIAPCRTHLIAAVESLYADRLRPFGRILRKRLVERSDQATPECDLVQLQKSCDECDAFVLTSEEGGEWCALLRHEPDNFIDVYDKVDNYPHALWSAAAAYFQALPEELAVLPGGRYACAQTLSNRNLVFLQGYTLGHICHFVQLALTTRKVLGYLNGGIAPYSCSHSCAKDKAAALQSSCVQTTSTSNLSIATWEVAKKCLKLIMRESLVSDSNQVPLSNIKRIFRSQFQTELSETSLGHSKLSELLQDDCLNDICTVRLLEQGYFVIPQFEIVDCGSDGDGSDTTAFSWADVVDEISTDGDIAFPDVEGFCETPCWLDDVNDADGMVEQSGAIRLCLVVDEQSFPERLATVNLVQNTFIHEPTQPWTSVPRRRSQSVPRCLGKTLQSPCVDSESPTRELMPVTPEMFELPSDSWDGASLVTPSFDYALQSVPEAQAMDAPMFSWDATGWPQHDGGVEFQHQYLQDEFQFVMEQNCFLFAQEQERAVTLSAVLTLADHV